MGKPLKVGFATKLLSNRNYLKEVSVEGKTTNKFNFNIGYYDQYAAQIIRSGNCITLLSNDISITKETFWNPNHFEDLTRYVFWTFNKSFLLTLLEHVERLALPVANRCALLLRENSTPYHVDLKNSPDEELRWCVVKNEHLIEDPKFEQMYALDKENRSAILDALVLRITPKETEQKEDSTKAADVLADSKAVSFIEVLRPIGNSADDTLQFIKLKLDEAKFELNLLSKINKLPNGKNPYGLNGAIAAMIDFFYQLNYFKKEYNLEEIFRAYSAYTGNSIAKFKTFFSEFRQDNNYRKHFEKLKSLKINKLK